MLQRSMSFAVVMAAICLFLSTSAHAQEGFSWPNFSAAPAVEAMGENDVALIVAIEEYAFLPNVPGAVANASDWEKFFRRGLAVENIFTLINRDATKEEILSFAAQAASLTQEDSMLWFVFIGHGSPVDGGSDGGIVGMDALQTVNSLSSRSVAQRELIAVLEGGRQTQTVVAIDACFSGRTGRGEALAVGMQPVLPVNAQPMVSASTIVLTAARADQYAGPLPGMERPAFTYLLLGALRGWAADGDDAVVTAADALWYVERQLRGVPGRQQTPELVGPGEVVLVRNATEPDPVRLWEERERRREEQNRQREVAALEVNCQGGRVAVSGQCCWPGQDWSSLRQTCVGRPTSCPAGRQIDGDSCIFAVVKDSTQVGATRHIPDEGASESMRGQIVSDANTQHDASKSSDRSAISSRKVWGITIMGLGAASVMGGGVLFYRSMEVEHNPDPSLSAADLAERESWYMPMIITSSLLFSGGLFAITTGNRIRKSANNHSAAISFGTAGIGAPSVMIHGRW